MRLVTGGLGPAKEWLTLLRHVMQLTVTCHRLGSLCTPLTSTGCVTVEAMNYHVYDHVVFVCNIHAFYTYFGLDMHAHHHMPFCLPYCFAILVYSD